MLWHWLNTCANLARLQEYNTYLQINPWEHEASSQVWHQMQTWSLKAGVTGPSLTGFWTSPATTVAGAPPVFKAVTSGLTGHIIWKTSHEGRGTQIYGLESSEVNLKYQVSSRDFQILGWGAGMGHTLSLLQTQDKVNPPTKVIFLVTLAQQLGVWVGARPIVLPDHPARWFHGFSHLQPTDGLST